MTHSSRASCGRRRMVLVAVAAALLCAATSLTIASGTASAATGTCDAGDFCMWYYSGFSGGLYEFSGSDSSLNNDYFENENTNLIVGNNTESVWNRGVSDPSGLIDVVAYTETGYGGSGLCIHQGRKADLPSFWDNNIASYRWVTRATCNRYQIL